MMLLSKTTITTAENLNDVIEMCNRHGWLTTSDITMLAECLPNMTITEDALFTLDGQLVPNARLIDQQGFHYPYDMIQTWRIGAKGEKPTWVTAFPKRKSTMTKKGYIEGTVTFNVTITIEIPMVGDAFIQINRVGDPIATVCA